MPFVDEKILPHFPIVNTLVGKEGRAKLKGVLQGDISVGDYFLGEKGPDGSRSGGLLERGYTNTVGRIDALGQGIKDLTSGLPQPIAFLGDVVGDIPQAASRLLGGRRDPVTGEFSASPLNSSLIDIVRGPTWADRFQGAMDVLTFVPGAGQLTKVGGKLVGGIIKKGTGPVFKKAATTFPRLFTGAAMYGDDLMKGINSLRALPGTYKKAMGPIFSKMYSKTPKRFQEMIARNFVDGDIMKIGGRFKTGGGRHAAGEVIDSRSLRQKAGDMFDRTFKSILGEKKFASLQQRSIYKSRGAYITGKGKQSFLKMPGYSEFISPLHLTGAFGKDAQRKALMYQAQYQGMKLGQDLTGMSDDDLAVLKELNPGTRSRQVMGRPISPIRQVNDMILTKDGQMIQTHEDDNLIAKKGGITQNTGGGKSRVEELLEQLIMVTQQAGDVFIDGAKVSSAINDTNYRA